MLKKLERSPGVIDKLDFKAIFKEIFSNKKLLMLLSFLFLTGYIAFGTFSYCGKYVETEVSSNMLTVGLVLTCWGIGSLIGGRRAGALYEKLGSKLPLFAGILGMVSLLGMILLTNYSIVIPLFGYGLAFVLLQSPLLTKVQEVTYLRGTATSFIGLCLFAAGGLGTTVNGSILNSCGLDTGFDIMFIMAAILMLIAGIITAYFFKRSFTPKATPNEDQSI
jgi:predicted MFS family arabinose efflux permease